MGGIALTMNRSIRNQGPEYMKQSKMVFALAALLAVISGAGIASAQSAYATAVRPLQLSAFGGVSGVYTGLAGGKNFSITAGVDLGLPPWRGIRPVVEVRGTYPTDRGVVDSQKDVLGGLKLQFLLNHRLHPYANFLYGRGEMDYYLGQYLFNNQFYEVSTSNIMSPGAGLDFDLSDTLSFKLDGQYQRWADTVSIPTPSGVLYSTVGTVGIVYRFNFDRRR